MKFNRQDQDLALAFIQVVLCQALAKNKASPALQYAKHLVDDGLAPAIVQRCLKDSWTDAVMAWKGSGHRVTDHDQFRRDIRKAAVQIGTTGDSQFAGPLVGITTLIEAYFRSLVNVSMTDAILQFAMPIQPNVKIGVTTSVASANSTAEAQWVPVTKMGFTGTQTVPSKATAITAVSDDVLRMGAELAANFLSAELRNAIARATDVVSVGILTAGLSPISSSSPRDDINAALAAINLASWSKPLIFVSPTMLKVMASMGGESGSGGKNGPPTFPDITLPVGGSVNGVPVAAIDSLSGYPGSPSGDSMLVVDAAQCGGNAGTVEVLTSNAASLYMDDAPSVGSPADEPDAAELVSLMQTNATAIRLTRWYCLARARSTAVAWVEGCDYSL